MSVRVSLGCDIYRAQHRRAECSLSASEDFKADSPNSRLYLWTDLSKDEEEYYDWKRVWESQNLHNGLFSTQSDPPATEKTRWTSASRGNRWILETYLPTDKENVSLETPEFVVTQPVITSFWNFLNIYEDPELNREKLPIQGLAMLLMGLRKQSSEECWESFIWKTSQFIKRIVKRKFQKKKKVWAELLLVVYYLLITLSPCGGETAFSTD